MRRLLETLATRRLLGDGAMGTQLQHAGLKQGECGEAWNLKYPERIVEIQRRYVEAGSDCLITNTFGGSRIALNRHGEGENATAINSAAVEVAREAFGDREGFIIGDIGPFGGMMEPYGEVPESEVRAAFKEQAQALVEAGADALIIETQSALEELRVGVEAAKEAGARCVIGSMAFNAGKEGKSFRTMMGVSPEQAAAAMVDLGVDILAMNCGADIDGVKAQEIIRIYRSVCDLPLMAQPNAGQPVMEDGRIVYKETPESMAEGVRGLLEAGVLLVGGCCGSTPDHIRAFRAVMDAFNSRTGG